jgi:hypothetical protein
LAAICCQQIISRYREVNQQDGALLVSYVNYEGSLALKVAAKLIAKGLGCITLLVGAVIKLLFD